ncbi:hypothetical protein scyTo_0024638 [Scyliorhinus torazame]|uniref:Uncharacterized protein n=1 Tax=Scyliorhinus torazame TaxID=75743 RepID=A0A401QFP1_SCYTO|nr:hypothetical protein [Scyliorhinus torazame]
MDAIYLDFEEASAEASGRVCDCDSGWCGDLGTYVHRNQLGNSASDQWVRIEEGCVFTERLIDGLEQKRSLCDRYEVCRLYPADVPLSLPRGACL